MNQNTKDLFLQTLGSDTGECEICNSTPKFDPKLRKSLPKPEPKKANVYKGIRNEKGPIVYVNGQILTIKGADSNRYYTYLDWGSCGYGCKMLAQAILAYEYDSTKAFAYATDFMYNTICELPEKEWVLTSDDITQAIANIDKKSSPRKESKWTPDKLN